MPGGGSPTRGCGCARRVSLFPFVGTVIYMVVRPPEYLDDVRERELEMQASEARLRGDPPACHLRPEVQADFLVCPNCYHRLESVPKLRQPLEQTWGVCPYCESPVRARPPRGAARAAAGEPVAALAATAH